MLSWHICSNRWINSDYPSARTWTWCSWCVSWVHLLFRWTFTGRTDSPSKCKRQTIVIPIAFCTFHCHCFTVIWVPLILIVYFSFFVLQCPVLVAWGDKDPWEPVELGKAYADFDTVDDFVILPDVGHCPQVSYSYQIFWDGSFPYLRKLSRCRLSSNFTQDEAPHLVNPLIEKFVACHTA